MTCASEGVCFRWLAWGCQFFFCTPSFPVCPSLQSVGGCCWIEVETNEQLGQRTLLDKVSLFSKCCCSVCCLVFPPPPKWLKLGFGGTNAFQAAVVALLVFGWTTATGFHTAILLSTFTVSWLRQADTQLLMTYLQRKIIKNKPKAIEHLIKS